MKVFLSWSKSSSHDLAQSLYDWLPEVIHEVEPWMSSEDISKGQRWSSEIGTQLDETNDGIICVTSDNVKEPWLNFEAGALAKSLADARVRPVLLNLQPSQVTGPLTQFQATYAADRADMLKLLKSLNAGCEKPLTEERLQRSFERTWHEFEEKISAIPSRSGPVRPTRDMSDMVAEILERVREIQRRPALDERQPDGREARPYVRRDRGLSGMLLSELMSVATSLGVEHTARMRKGELIAAIQERQSSTDARFRPTVRPDAGPPL